MSNSDLFYFEEELSYFREKSSSFAKKYPEVASALGISDDSVDDPEIARLVESVCLLNSRIQKRLDDDFSDFTESLLRVIYPDYLKPVPAYSLFKVDVNNDANAKAVIPRNSLFEVGEKGGEHCFFSTTRDLEIYPMQLQNVNIYNAPFDESNIVDLPKANTMLEFVFNSTDASQTLRDIGVNKIDLHIRSSGNLAMRIYDEIRINLLDIYVECSGQVFHLGSKALYNPNFELDSTVIPYSKNTFPGLGLLSEFFMFQDVFCMFRFDLSSILEHLNGGTCKVKLYLKESRSEVLHLIQKEHFNLYTVPVINLYREFTDPIEINFMKDAYPLIISDNRTRRSLYSVEKIYATRDSVKKAVLELYDEKFDFSGSTKRWMLKTENNDGFIEGKVSFVDLSHNVAVHDSCDMVAEVMVTDGYRVNGINFADVAISPMKAMNIPGSLKFLRRPSVQINPREEKSDNWDILAHLKLNYLFAVSYDELLLQLKCLFKLYNRNGSRQNDIYIDAMKHIQYSSAVEPIRISGKSYYACGARIVVTLNPHELSDGIYVFAEFLNKFFSLFVSFNSFVQLSVMLEGSDEPYVTFPRRMGCQDA